MNLLDKFRKTKTSVPAAKAAATSVKSEKVKTETKAAPLEAKPAVKAVRAKGVTSNAYQVLIEPLITEKASALNVLNKYVFVVAASASKQEIKKAVSQVYGVQPVKVSLSNVSGKKVAYGRTFGQQKHWKKAIVTLPAGKTIQIYEGV